MIGKHLATISFVISLIEIGIVISVNGKTIENYEFPDNFAFGASSAAHQIGAWNVDGKSPNIWDHLTHKHPEVIADKSNGDDAAKSYFFHGEDVKALKSVGFQHYRFSVAWTRILPDGKNVNMKGINYYQKLIDELIENDIVPIITMYHFDLPQCLQDLGGFLNPEIIDHFEKYADILFKYFGEKVKTWITFNEPYYTCVDGYGTGTFIPMVNAQEIGGDYLCMHHTLIAHAKVYKLYKAKYFSKQQGRIGIAPNTRGYKKKDDSITEDVVERGMQFLIGWILNPIFGEKGNYPQIIIETVGNNSLNEGRNASRLPFMPEKLQNYIKGTADFIGVNYYTSRLVEMNKDTDKMKPSWEKDFGLNFEVDPLWEKAHSPWLYSVPEGLRQVLVWLKNTYNNPTMLITENGCSDNGEIGDDNFRIKYLKDHLIAVSNATLIDNCNIESYYVWSIIDNFEWMRGYLDRFGLFYVNFTSPTRERIPKKSVGFMTKVIKNRFVSIKDGD